MLVINSMLYRLHILAEIEEAMNSLTDSAEEQSENQIEDMLSKWQVCSNII